MVVGPASISQVADLHVDGLVIRELLVFIVCLFQILLIRQSFVLGAACVNLSKQLLLLLIPLSNIDFKFFLQIPCRVVLVFGLVFALIID